MCESEGPGGRGGRGREREAKDTQNWDVGRDGEELEVEAQFRVIWRATARAIQLYGVGCQGPGSFFPFF